jgi:hypothetical protein
MRPRFHIKTWEGGCELCKNASLTLPVSVVFAQSAAKETSEKMLADKVE